MPINDLPAEVLFHLLYKLLDRTDRFNFAISNKQIWLIATRFGASKCTLKYTINALELISLKQLTIGESSCDTGLVKHVLSYANNLSEIKFLGRPKFTFRFAEVFMTIKRPCTFIIPKNAYNQFALAKEESENKLVTISLNSSATLLDDMKTPEEMLERVQVFKAIEKQRHLKLNGNIFISKSNLSNIVFSRISDLLNINEYQLYDNSHPKEDVTNSNEADNTVLFSQRFVEAVVILNKHWFFVTRVPSFYFLLDDFKLLYTL